MRVKWRRMWRNVRFVPGNGCAETTPAPSSRRFERDEFDWWTNRRPQDARQPAAGFARPTAPCGVFLKSSDQSQDADREQIKTISAETEAGIVRLQGFGANKSNSPSQLLTSYATRFSCYSDFNFEWQIFRCFAAIILFSGFNAALFWHGVF